MSPFALDLWELVTIAAVLTASVRPGESWPILGGPSADPGQILEVLLCVQDVRASGMRCG